MEPGLLMALGIVAWAIWCAVAAWRDTSAETETLTEPLRSELEACRERVRRAEEAYQKWERCRRRHNQAQPDKAYSLD